MSEKTKGDSLKIYFYIAFLIPIIATILVTWKDGLQTELVTTQISASALIIIMSMVHAPTVAALIVTFRDEGFDGIWNKKAISAVEILEIPIDPLHAGLFGISVCHFGGVNDYDILFPKIYASIFTKHSCSWNTH